MSKLRSHVRHNAVGYIALFFALTGSAVAVSPALHVGDSAGGDLTGTYPNPTIAANKVDSAKVNDGSLTAADIAAANKDGSAATPSLRTLGTGPQQAVAGNDARLSDARTPIGAAGGDLAGTYPNPSIANGSVTTSKFAPGAQAPDSAKLGGKSPGEYGAVMSGRVNGLRTTEGSDFGAVSGFSTASATEGDVTTLSPNHDLVARDFSVEATAQPTDGTSRGIQLLVNGSPALDCIVVPPGFGNADCINTSTASVPANSRLSIKESVATVIPGDQTAASDLRFGFRLTP